MVTLVESYFNTLRHMLAADNVFLFWKGRVALYAILKTMGIGAGDEVILPAYTCVVVPNAIMYLGAVPIYVDISPETYNMDVTKVESAITKKTRAIICQNTYGLSSNIEETIAIAKRCGLYTIEDCTHGFGGYYNGRPNGSYCDAAFYSTQWNKPFSTGLGGFCVINNSSLLPAMREIINDANAPSFKDRISLALLHKVRRHLLTDSNYWILLKTYRFLSKYNLILGSSQGREIESPVIPQNYFKGVSHIQAREGIRNLKSLEAVLAKRKQNAKLYTDYLSAYKKNHVPLNQFGNHSFLKYPLLVGERNAFIKSAEQSRIRIGDWFTSPLHPVDGDLTPWHYDRNQFPVADTIAQRIVNLPTDVDNVAHIFSFLDKCKDIIL